MDKPNIQDWIGTGKKLSDAPKSIRKTLNAAFIVPETVKAAIFPNTSLRGLISSTFPASAPAVKLDNPSLIQKYFRRSPAGPVDSASTLVKIKRLPIPDTKTINILMQASRQAILDGYQSIVYGHIGNDVLTRFDLAILTIWKQMARMKDCRGDWLRKDEWLQSQLRRSKTEEQKAAVLAANAHITTIPWDCRQRITDNKPATELHRLLGNSWLSTSLVDSELEFLRGETLCNPDLASSVRVENSGFTNILLDAYRNGKEGAVHQHGWLKDVGEDVREHGTTMVTIANLEKVQGAGVPHWVAVAVDASVQTLWYGDSLGGDAPAELADAYSWWFSQHQMTPFVMKRLDITRQCDGFNCAFFGFNGLYRFIWPSIPLYSSEVRELVFVRLETFNKFADRVQALSEGQFDAETDSDDDDDDGVWMVDRPESTVPSSEFSFQFSVPTLGQEKDAPLDLPQPSSSTAKASDNFFGSKRAYGTADAPTPMPSPQKKRTSKITADESITIALFSPSNAPIHATSEGCASATMIPGALKGKLTDFFGRETGEQRAARYAREFERKRENRDDRVAVEQHDRQSAEVLKREGNRKRQQDLRDRQHALKVADGWVPKRGNFRKRARIDLENDESEEDGRIAEISRPYRQFKENERVENKEPSGMKRQKVKEDAIRVNWRQKFLHDQIDLAAKQTGKPWSARAIMKRAKQNNPQAFATLTEQVVGRMIDSEAKKRGISKWKDSVLVAVGGLNGNQPHHITTRTGILTPYPVVCHAINTRLGSLRNAGVPLTLTTIRAIIIALIQQLAPHLFRIRQTDNSFFCCSESFVRKYLRNTLQWSHRRATKAAKKVPENVEEVLTNAFLREAMAIRDYAIPAALRVNTDQTQVIYQQGSSTSWTERGSKQVSTSGHDEKRAFTLVPTISADGDMLPMQAIYHGQTNVSCPSPKSALFKESLALGLRLLPSKTATYWSTFATMQDLVNNILVPFFDTKKKELGLPVEQRSIWKIDCWSVHKSAEFLNWMREHHPNIIIIFVPGCCTSLWQPLDVGIQRIMKLAMKRASHRDIVTEVESQLEQDPDAIITLDNTIRTLRNRSIGWIVNAINDISSVELVKKAFEMCRVGEFNCSHESMASPAALAALRELPIKNPTLYAELMLSNKVPSGDEPEEAFNTAEDDSDIPLDVLKNVILFGDKAIKKGYAVTDDGTIVRTGSVEDDDFTSIKADGPEDSEEEMELVLPDVSRRGRVIKKSAKYLAAWERH